MIKSGYANLSEAKQVGTLYHYTTLLGLLGILKDDKIRKQVYEDKGKSKQGVSLTRNKNLNFTKGYNSVMIILDGDKISNNYKVEPINAWSKHEERGATNPTNREQEERVLGDLNHVSKYIVSVVFNEALGTNDGYKGATSILGRQSSKLDEICKLLDDKSIKHNLNQII